MVRELIIHSNANGVEIALLEDKKLMEFHLDRDDQNEFSAGDIYLGRIKKINPGLNAAFIDIGHEKDAFIHYSDLSPSFLSLKKFTKGAEQGKQVARLDKFELEKLIDKDGNIQEVLQKGDWVITQIMKEAISTKGPRMTCEVTIPGRDVVLAPFTNSVGISKKITDSSERQRLNKIINQVRPHNFGIVVRTNARNLSEEAITKDIDSLVLKWENLTKELNKPNAPRRLLSEIGKSFSLIRDMLNDSFERVICDDEKLFEDLKSYLEKKAPKYSSKLELYTGVRPIFDEFDVSRQVKNSFGKNVTLKSGAYLIIEHTEALHVIDVNSGPKIKKVADQDANAFQVNQEAGLEIARQLRLRDIGGIVVIDFIDMKSSDYRTKIYQMMDEAMKSDRARHSILPISRFGLMEITRQRAKSELELKSQDRREYQSTKKISPQNIYEEIEKEIASLRKAYKASGNKYILSVHPLISAYLQKGYIPITWKWYYNYRKKIGIQEDPSLELDEFYLLNEDRVTRSATKKNQKA